MKFRPLRDSILTVDLEASNKVGALWLPDHHKQALLTHGKALVLASGPKAAESCPPGTIVHVKETWGEAIRVGEKRYRVGRIRDINGVCEGEQIADTGKYLD